MFATLPRDAEGRLLTSAEFGESHVVRVQWNTDFDGRVIDPGKEEYPETFHGPFVSQEEATEWMDAFCPDDTDVHDIFVIIINNVRKEGS